MSSQRKLGLFLILIGGLLLAYGIWAFCQGEVLSTWLRMEVYPSFAFWITVVTLIGLGGANMVMGVLFITKARKDKNTK